VFIHVLLREGVDDDVAAWYDAQSDKSQAVREALRLAIQVGTNGGRDSAVKEAVAEVLQRYMPDLVSAAVSRALASYRLVSAEQANEGDADEQERARARALLNEGVAKFEED